MFAISWKMTLVVLSLAPICVLVVRIQRFYARLLGKERADRLARASGFVRECLGALRAVRSFAAEDRKADEYREIVADVYEVSFQARLFPPRPATPPDRAAGDASSRRCARCRRPAAAGAERGARGRAGWWTRRPSPRRRSSCRCPAPRAPCPPWAPRAAAHGAR